MKAAVAIPDSDRALRLLETGKNALAEARSIGEVKTIRDQAAAVSMYLRQQQLSEEAARDAAELKVRAERRLGEMLKETVVTRGHHSPGVNGSTKSLPNGIEPKQSSRWQRVAAVPKKAFETYVEECREGKAEITTAAVMRLAKPEEERAPSPGSFDLLTELPAIREWLEHRREKWPVKQQDRFLAFLRNIIEHWESGDDVTGEELKDYRPWLSAEPTQDESEESGDSNRQREAILIRANEAIQLAGFCRKMATKINATKDVIKIARRAAAAWADLLTYLESKPVADSEDGSAEKRVPEPMPVDPKESAIGQGEEVTIRLISKRYGQYGLTVLDEYLAEEDEDTDRAKGQLRRFRVLKPLPTKTEYATLEQTYFTSTVGGVISNSFAELEELGEELVQWHENLPESFQGSERGEAIEEASSALQALERPDVPKELEDIPVIHKPGPAGGRSRRRDDAVGGLAAVVEVLRGHKRHSKASALADELEGIIQEAGDIEFPGMYG